jgi:hypothetical protein
MPDDLLVKARVLQTHHEIGTNDFRTMYNFPFRSYQAFSQKGVQASWDAPRTKNGRLWTPKFLGKGKLFSIISLSTVY